MITAQLIEKALKTAQGAQAVLRESEETDVSFENNRLKSISPSQRTSINLKVIVDGKVGTSTTTDVRDLDGVVERAVAAACFGSTAHYQFASPQPAPPVELYDEKVRQLSTQEMMHIGQGMLDQVRAYNADILVSAGVTRRTSRLEYANSSGTQFTDRTTSLNMGTFGNLVRGTDILETGYGKTSRSREIDSEDISDQTIQWFRLSERLAEVKSGRMPVIFTPLGMSVLLLSLYEGFNGKSVFLGESPLSSKLGQQIADPLFTLMDNPLIDYSPASHRYDEEGVPHRPVALIENGVAKNFLYDLDTAGRAGTQSTGHGVGCNPIQLVVSTGSTPYEDMIKSVKEGILVHQVMGLGQGNSISGEFSVNVHLGFKIENGEITGRVKDVMLAGNVYDALNDIAAIGSQAEWVPPNFSFCSMLTPAMQIGALNIVTN